MLFQAKRFARMESVCGFEFGSHLIDAIIFPQPFRNMLNWLLFEEACVPTGFREMFSNHAPSLYVQQYAVDGVGFYSQQSVTHRSRQKNYPTHC